MIIEETYQFNYELFLAEQEMYESLVEYGAVVSRESYGLFLLNEGVKDVVVGYLQKVGESISKVWNKFKEIFNNEKDKVYLKSIQEKINSADPKFTIGNFPTYNLSRLNEIKTVELNFEQMKDDLTSKETFVSKYYPNIKIDDNNKKFKDAIQTYCLEKREDTRCTPELLKEMYRYCLNDYQNSIKSIEDDLKRYNTSSKNIQNLVNQVSSAETSQTECVAIYESFLLEADNDQKSNKVEFKDDPDAKQQGQGSNDITKKITTFVKITTDILSAKMSMTREIYRLYMDTIRHYIKPTKAQKEEDKKQESNNTNNGSVEVEI